MIVFRTFLLFFLRSVAADGKEVSCVFPQRCVLPCSFQSHGDDVIHWFHHNGSELRVHSYYDNQDQLGHQDQNFRGRTSLFLDQISRGNASLLLTGVKVQDEGTYRCYTSTIHENRETFMNLTVNAPVSDIRIHQDGNRITCSSEGIYPQPELTWSTEPPSNTALQNRTTVHQTEEKLYDISSSLTGPDGPDLIYSCSIRTRRNQRRATFRELSASVWGGVSTIPCSAPNSSLQNFSVSWRFNHSQVIATQAAGSAFTASDGWRKRVEGVSASGSLALRGLSSNQDGVYSCELSDEEQTLITNILLKTQEGGHSGVTVIVSCLLTIILLAALLIASLMVYKKNLQNLQMELETLQNASRRHEVHTAV
ncbi:PREDICTED: HERV-H LTR-associating protein 2 isoform X1 [Poecilia mexicana]|uniref:Ig-like domain-containing protein n=1 Tax=Poecilia mexicana TaxID=48701 RepID=A0A3B3XIK6_9TELE|nr:PREDICTED: HERV-H LTR-associating protein 2 isoform X1 [Poecilia mexicana]